MAAAVVAHRAADVLRHGIQVLDQVVDALGFQRGVAGEGFVEVGHVSVVVLAVMDFHGGLVDVGFQGLGRVGQRG